MPLYRLRKAIRVQKVMDLQSTANGGFEFTNVAAGETVEAISGMNQEGRLLIRHEGHCYRAWKEDLRNECIAHRLVPERLPNRLDRDSQNVRPRVT